jgi:hypothetical protein
MNILNDCFFIRHLPLKFRLRWLRHNLYALALLAMPEALLSDASTPFTLIFRPRLSFSLNVLYSYL